MKTIKGIYKVEKKTSRWQPWLKWAGVVSGAAALGLIAQRWARPRDVRWVDQAQLLDSPQTSNFRVIDGVRIHYQDIHLTAQAEPLVLIHGFCASTYTWKDCVRPLAKAGYRVITVDLKGYGFSEKPADDRYDIMDQVNLIMGLLDSLKINQANFVGNSYGGAISMASALAYPKRVKRLVLIDPAHNNQALQRVRYLAPLINLSTIAQTVGPILFSSRRVIEYYLRKMYYNAERMVTSDRIAAYYEPLRTAACQTAALATIQQWRLDWIAKEMSTISVPTLLIWGEQDWLLPIEWGAEIDLAIPHAQFMVIPHCGHLPQEEHPQDTCALIAYFCRQK
jgi:pimeloyl-ACP methyl ester carboxylesterase